MIWWKHLCWQLPVVALLVGCGGRAADAPVMGRVSGVVTLDGNPVAGATVEFAPDNERKTKGPKSSGVTDAQGKYTLSGPGGQTGAVVGFHKVTVTCPPSAEQSSSISGASSAPTTPCTVPVKFADSKTSGESKEVKTGTNDLPITLKS